MELVEGDIITFPERKNSRLYINTSSPFLNKINVNENGNEELKSVETEHTLSSLSLFEHSDLYTFTKRYYEMRGLYITRIYTLLSIGVLCFWDYTIVKNIINNKSFWMIIFLLLNPLFFWFILFPMQIFTSYFINTFASQNFLKQNSQFYSYYPTPIATQFHDYPNITIQLPVYTEDLERVIIPTIKSALKAKEYYERNTQSECNIFINDDGLQVITEKEKNLRLYIYDYFGIGVIGRPIHNRKGKFKKASNMNICMNISFEYKQLLDMKYDKDVCMHIIKHRYPNFIIQGNILINEFILLIDSDTRIPENCLYLTIPEFLNYKNLGYTQHLTTSMSVTNNFWENFICHFTNNIYNNGIKYNVSSGTVCPLVGHNAILRTKAIVESVENPLLLNQKISFWNENTVSEDFDLSLRMHSNSYYGRYIVYTKKEFKEGVSLTINDEIKRFCKYGYGTSEILFNNFSTMIKKKEIFNSIIKNYIKNKNIRWEHKIDLLSYMGIYYAISLGSLFTILNFCLLTFNEDYSKIIVKGFDIMMQIIMLFSVFCPLCSTIQKYRKTKSKKFFILLYDEFKYLLFFMLFFGCLGFPILKSIFYFFINSSNIGWQTTVKEISNNTYSTEIKTLYLSNIHQFIFGGICISLVLFFYIFNLQNNYLIYTPVLFCGSTHILGPILLNPTILKMRY